MASGGKYRIVYHSCGNDVWIWADNYLDAVIAAQTISRSFGPVKIYEQVTDKLLATVEKRNECS